MTRSTPAAVAQVLRRLLDIEVPGWRDFVSPVTGRPRTRIVAVAHVSGVGLMECVLYVRGGLDGEALPDDPADVVS